MMVVVHERPPYINLNLLLIMDVLSSLILIVVVMINSCKKTKQINSFQYVAIPSPRDVFARYGERLSNRGEYSSSGEQVAPAMVSSGSMIDQMINAQSYLEREVTQ